MGIEISVDLPKTRRRIARLRSYVEANLLDNTAFRCACREDCTASRRAGDVFRQGIMSHVGRRFDLIIDGRPLRVVVVGQESGFPRHSLKFAQRVTIDMRYQQVHDGSGLEHRYYSDGVYPGRNPHMRGTTSALRVLFGGNPGDDHDGEMLKPVKGRPFHIFDAFALVNRLLCSAGPPGSSTGHPTKTMFKNCARHFIATMEILEPTIVVLQGRAVADSTHHVLVRGQTYTDYLHEAHVGKQRMMVCEFSHPSAHGQFRWGDSLNAPYLNDVVVPTLREALLRT